MRLTQEQLDILKEADCDDVSITKILRITAGAGSGKTTTLLELARRYSEQRVGDSITYLTFNKAAAKDGRRRLAQAAPNLVARTLHSCAMELMAEYRGESAHFAEDKAEAALLTDDELQEKIKELRKNDITKFLDPAIDKLKEGTRKEREKKMKTMEDQVVFYIYKTLLQFCHRDSSHELLKTNIEKGRPNYWKRNYYPAGKYHEEGGLGEKSGFPSAIYSSKISFYADQASKVWDELVSYKTFDLEMKRAQLLKLNVPGQVLLIDESQDLDECQIQWLSAGQRDKHIFFVGDAAQTIYSFRGAKSRYLMGIENAVDYTLTTSFRFGPKIADMANVVLFAKTHSPQTKGGKHAMWKPYSVTGAGDASGYVTTDSLNGHGQMTLIARNNATLLLKAVEMLGIKIDEAKVGEVDVVEQTGGDEEYDEADDIAIHNAGDTPLERIPTFHLNGSGEFSGLRGWKKRVREIQTLYLLKNGEINELPKSDFPQFAHETWDWGTFLDFCEAREITTYKASVQVIAVLGDMTLEAIELFEAQVMNNHCSADEADIILSTCHAAKGMEWDHVQVCDDFIPLDRVILRAANTGKKRKRDRDKVWEYNFTSYGDDVNLLYVAFTRAKRILSVPKSIQQFLLACDKLDKFAKTPETDLFGRASTSVNGLKGFRATFGDSKDQRLVFERQAGYSRWLHQDLIEPLRLKLHVGQNSKLCDVLIRGQDGVKTVTPESTPQKSDMGTSHAESLSQDSVDSSGLRQTSLTAFFSSEKM